jgi:hypothetical protein
MRGITCLVCAALALGAQGTPAYDAMSGVGDASEGSGRFASVVVSPADPIIGTPEGEEPGKVQNVFDVLGISGSRGFPGISGPVHE